jgi:CheY-like chemotaxis protein
VRIAFAATGSLPSLLVICHSSFVIRHLSFAIRHSSFAIRHSSFAIRHLPYVIRQMYNARTSFPEMAVPRTYRVLAVDDDENNYQLVCTILQKFPVKIRRASTGNEAIAYLEREVPDLILLDINLPDMYGWEVLDKFRADERLKHAPVIVVTAHKEPVHRLIGSLQSVAVYMHKPIVAEELRRQVTQLLNLDA